MSLKYMYIGSQVIAHDVNPGFCEFFVHAEFWMVNLDISLSLFFYYFIKKTSLHHVLHKTFNFF